MKRLRRFDFIAMAAIVVLAVGSVVAITMCTASPTCPTSNTVKPSSFCLSPAERALGQAIVHDPTIPDSVMMQGPGTLTIGPHDRSAITKTQAEEAAVTASARFGFYNHAVVRSAILAEEHDDGGNPAHGQLVWIVDITPPGGAPPEACGGFGACTQPPKSQRFTIEVVSASTGVALGTYEN